MSAPLTTGVSVTEESAPIQHNTEKPARSSDWKAFILPITALAGSTTALIFNLFHYGIL